MGVLWGKTTKMFWDDVKWPAKNRPAWHPEDDVRLVLVNTYMYNNYDARMDVNIYIYIHNGGRYTHVCVATPKKIELQIVLDFFKLLF